jgi:hypothetical protein
MAGCGGLLQVSGTRTATPDSRVEPSGVSAAGSAAVRPSGEVVAAGGHRPHRTFTEPELLSSVCPPTG